jgi:hypothetical protein
MRLSRFDALWYLLTCLELKLTPQIEGFNIQQFAAMTDNYLNAASYGIRWIRKECSIDNLKPQLSFSDKHYKSAERLLELGALYDFATSAYTYSSNGWMDLDAKKGHLIPSKNFLGDSRYEAYGRLTKPNVESPSLTSLQFVANEVIRAVDRNNPGEMPTNIVELLDLAADPIGKSLRSRFSLPEDWRTSRYSFEEFRRIYARLCALGAVQQFRRSAIENQFDRNFENMQAVLITRLSQLVEWIAQPNGLPHGVVRAVLDDLTFGNRGIRAPDPMLQPLFEIVDGSIALTPSILLNSSAERNLATLMNKIPKEQAIYSKLVDEKEEKMRARLQSELGGNGLRFESGRMPGNLPDLDLAVIDDLNKECFVCEMKWFIEPAEAREVIDKSKELTKGIGQASRLSKAISEGSNDLHSRLRINSEYRVTPVVLSETWIGFGNIQDESVPIIKIDHFRSVVNERGMSDIRSWLLRRDYLPEEGKHYEIKPFNVKIGRWKLEWYGINPLIGNRFWPV